MLGLQKNKKVLLFIIYILFGLSVSICSIHLAIDPAVARNLPQQEFSLERPIKPDILEEQGKQAYRLANYEQARKLWQQARQKYQQNRNILGQARVSSNLALADYKLGNLQQAKAEINKSRALLKSQSKNPDFQLTLARVFNNQGIIQLAMGEAQEAIASWDLAIVAYQKVEDDLGEIRARLNQARAFKTLRLYQRAVDSFTAIGEAVAEKPDSALKGVVLRNYGDILRLIGKVKESQQVLEQSLAIAYKLNLPEEKVRTLLALGHTIAISGDVDIQESSFYYDRALQTYQTGLKLCQAMADCLDSDLFAQLNLAQLNLGTKTQSWQETIQLIPIIQRQIAKPATNYDRVDFKISFADSLLEIQQINRDRPSVLAAIPTTSEIINLLDSAIVDARNLDYSQAESYAYGLKGHIQELAEDWEQASKSTSNALKIAQAINTREISYLWEWQLGRIDRARGKREMAISHYLQGVTLLDSLSHDVANIDNTIRYTFREKIEPVYREAVDLLLDVPPDATISPKHLIQARDTLESLQIAELNNFFREACVKGNFVPIDAVDSHAAAIYPIILRDRLEIILSLPFQPLKRYSLAIPQAELEATIAELRRNVVIRSRRTFYQPATKLYQWLINPILKDLATYQIETLVFIPDGALRSLPFAALYDGNNYLIEQYNLVLNPGLQLLDPNPLQTKNLSTLAAGLTKSKENFAPLQYVGLELAEIETQIKSEILLDEQFTTVALREEIQFENYPIVHIATHGQFGSSLEDTFLLAWDERIDLGKLQYILKARTDERRKAIEFLVLSACETATGDKRATLGLAGIAIQAGAKSTMATLWSINDRATAELMSHLYRELGENKLSKAKAIRKAQLSLLHNSEYKHPFYWAAYTTIGNWL